MEDDLIRLATRTSPLALYQAELVAEKLREARPDIKIELVGVESAGDRDQQLPIREFASYGAFSTAVDRAVARHEADIAVHSAKDLPSSEAEDDLVLAAVPAREDPRDVLVGARLSDLAPGALIATGSVRRRVQLAFVRPDLGFVDVRGNIATRVAKAPRNGAVVIARAALLRLGIGPSPSEVLSTTVMLPQIGQGAIGLRCRSDDQHALELAAAIDDDAAHRAVRAERSFLRHIGGGCDAPVAALATAVGDSAMLDMQAMVASCDGHVVTKARSQGDNPEQLGVELAEQLMERYGALAVIDRSGVQ